MTLNESQIPVHSTFPTSSARPPPVSRPYLVYLYFERHPRLSTMNGYGAAQRMTTIVHKVTWFKAILQLFCRGTKMPTSIKGTKMDGITRCNTESSPC
ncbi:hypothetical protein KSC_040910 [Ktedonobacter sp. SOSP1-52]|nr:hypothetical protein KSC_040910 [Ktedonobacter sp. SOSP1-52]